MDVMERGRSAIEGTPDALRRDERGFAAHLGGLRGPGFDMFTRRLG